jgi:hypothetical protein
MSKKLPAVFEECHEISKKAQCTCTYMYIPLTAAERTAFAPEASLVMDSLGMSPKDGYARISAETTTGS